jgi:hypothetical protein
MSSASPETTRVSLRTVVPMFLAGLLMILLFWGSTELIRSWVSTGSNYEAEQSEIRVKNLQDLTATNQTELFGYTWVNKDAGTVRIPIERAMELEIAALNETKPKPSTLTDPDAAAAEAAAKAQSTAPSDITAPAAANPVNTAPAPVPAQEAPSGATPAVQ